MKRGNAREYLSYIGVVIGVSLVGWGCVETAWAPYCVAGCLIGLILLGVGYLIYAAAWGPAGYDHHELDDF